MQICPDPLGVPAEVTPGKIILGELGDIDSGVRRLIRNTPLEVMEIVLPSGQALRVRAALTVRMRRVAPWHGSGGVDDSFTQRAFPVPDTGAKQPVHIACLGS